MNRFFINCPIGFEDILIEELQYKWSYAFQDSHLEIVEKSIGGIEIECNISKGLNLNKILKVPNRILLRVKTQKCRDLPKLYKILKKIDWKEYYEQENILFNISTKTSRLIHSKRINDTAESAIKDYFNANKLSKKSIEKTKDYPNQTVFIRLIDDLLTISLDTSGPLLHIRSNSSFRGHASLRENYASAILINTLKLRPQKLSIIDPMCGTGTLLKEALSFCELNNRDFSYNYWTQDYESKIDEVKTPWEIEKLIGIDIDNNIINKNKELSKNKIEYINADSLNYKMDISHDNVYVISNPPYGKRVKIKDDKSNYFNKLFSIPICQSSHSSTFLIPQIYANKLRGSKLYFNQNGIKIAVVTHK